MATVLTAVAGHDRMPAPLPPVPACRGLDLGFTAASDDPQTRDRLDRLLAPLRTEDGAGRRHYRVARSVEGRFTVLRDGERRWQGDDRDHATAVVLWQITADAVAATVDRCTLLHAAVVTSQGAALLLPGASGAGKTTLAAALTLGGLAYLSDEVAAVDPGSGALSGLPRPFALEDGARQALARMAPAVASLAGPGGPDRFVAPTDLGTVGSGPASPAAVVFPRWQAGIATRLRPLRRVAALARCVEGTFEFSSHYRRDLATLAALLDGLPCYELDYGDLASACALLRTAAGWPAP